MTAPALTAESEALLARDQHCNIRRELTAIEAAAVARHVRETGCEGLREALVAALRWAMDRVSSSHVTTRYSHPLECSPSECRCGYWQARAAIEGGRT